MREMQRIRKECEEWDGNASAENHPGNAGNLGGNKKNVGNQGRNLSIAIEIT